MPGPYRPETGTGTADEPVGIEHGPSAGNAVFSRSPAGQESAVTTPPDPDTAPSPSWQGGFGTPPPAPVLPAPGTDGFSIASLVLGILPVLAGLLGVVFGLISLSRIKRSGQGGRGMALAGTVLGGLWLVGITAVVVWHVVDPRAPDRRPGGGVSAPTSIDADDLRVGDCVAALPDPDNIEPVRLLPCEQPHDGEVFSTSRLAAGPYPGRDEAQRLTEDRCAADLKGFAGPTAADTYELYFAAPSQAGWNSGGRRVTCLLHDPDGRALTGDARKTGGAAPA
jgi:Domain of unknown function (DUF4190)/Septum formation